MLKDKAFTLLETLVNLSLVVILFIILPTLFTSFSSVTHNDLSVEKFLIMLNEELTQAYSITTHDNKLYLNTHPNRTIIIEQYENIIRKRVNHQGHEIYLRQIKRFEVSKHKQLLKVTLITHEDVKYEKTYAL